MLDDPYFMVNKNKLSVVTSGLKLANIYMVSCLKDISEILNLSKLSVAIPFSVKILNGSLPTSCSVIMICPITKVGSSYGNENWQRTAILQIRFHKNTLKFQHDLDKIF